MYKKFELEGLCMGVETYQGRDGQPECRVVLGFMGDQMRISAEPNRHTELKQFINKNVVCSGTIDHQLKTFGSKADERYSFHMDAIKKSASEK